MRTGQQREMGFMKTDEGGVGTQTQRQRDR